MKIYSPAKINIFLKIIGKRGNYHEIISRFIKFDDLNDITFFEKKKIINNEFNLIGNFGCNLEDNTIFKTYKALIDAGFNKKLDEFFSNYEVRVEKNIPFGSGLGGGSSNAASFLLFCNEKLSLNLSIEEMGEIAKKIGSDVMFFLYGYKSANVGGLGEIIDEFNDEIPPLCLKHLKIFSSTKEVYSCFRENFWQNIDINLSLKLKELTSKEILNTFSPSKLNDLFLPAIKCNKALEEYLEKNFFMSGSGSSMFRIKNG